MKKKTIWRIIGILIFICLSNIPPLYHFFHLIGDGVLVEPLSSDYITKDKIYVYGGWLKDSLSDPYYKRYRLLYPHNDPTLYRVHPIQPWKFWRWRDYLTEEKWRRPYLKIDYADVRKIFYKFGQDYNPYEGSWPPRTHEDSSRVLNYKNN